MEKELIDRLKERVEHALTSNTEECIPFKYKDRDGYGSIQFCHNGKKGKCRTHRLVYEIVHNDELTPEDVIMHSCDNPNCCNPRHLSKGTHKDNQEVLVKKEQNSGFHQVLKTMSTLHHVKNYLKCFVEKKRFIN